MTDASINLYRAVCIALVATCAASATGQVPMPPLPKGGSLLCSMRNQAGVSFAMVGKLAPSSLQAVGKKYDAIDFISTNADLQNTFDGRWTLTGGEFSSVDKVRNTLSTFAYNGSTFASGDGGALLKVSPITRGKTVHYAGFCQSTFLF